MTLEVTDAGRYENVFVGDDMVASYSEADGEFCVYNPNTDSEDPEYVVDLS